MGFGSIIPQQIHRQLESIVQHTMRTQAQESSCRARYGPGTTWMATLDVDEYLITTGERWKTLRHWLEHVTSDEDDTKILSFYQTRALPNIDLMVPYEGGPASLCKVDKNISTLKSMCVMKVWNINAEYGLDDLVA